MNPIILGIDTATDACSVALSTEDQIMQQFVVEPQAHSKLILGMVDNICQQAGLELNQIHAFAYGKGPGSFTGLRIAASVIQGLAFGVNKPVIAVSSLRALAQQAHNKTGIKHIVPILDARMQEVYCGSYIADAEGLMQEEFADCLLKPENINFATLGTALAVGTGCSSYNLILQNNYPNLPIDTDIQYPRAKEIVQLAIAEYLDDNLLRADQVLPVYIRNDVAKKGKKNPD